MRTGRTHLATVPVPAGFAPCAHLYPPHPFTDGAGRPRPFDPTRVDAFARLLDRYGDPAQAEITAAVTSAVRAGAGPESVPTPTDPPGRAARAVAVRKLAHSAASLEVLSGWRRSDGPAPVLDPEGDRNAVRFHIVELIDHRAERLVASAARSRTTGSRCESGAVLATVTGERRSTTPLGPRSWEGGPSRRSGSQETVCGDESSRSTRDGAAEMSNDAAVQPQPNQPSVDQSDRRVPINLRQSGPTPVELLISTRIRKSPYWHLSMEAGCWRAEVYNRVYHPRGYVEAGRRRGDGRVRRPGQPRHHVERRGRAADPGQGSGRRGLRELRDHPRRHQDPGDARPLRDPLQRGRRDPQRPGAAAAGRGRVLVQPVRLRSVAVAAGGQRRQAVRRGDRRDRRLPRCRSRAPNRST